MKGKKTCKNMYWYLVGITAAFLTTFGFVPQMIKMQRTKSSRDVSLVTLFQFSAGVILWTLYGFHIEDSIIIAANSISFITLIASIVLYYHYMGK
jgi:MtN3 and saliva related transmembrane protein